MRCFDHLQAGGQRPNDHVDFLAGVENRSSAQQIVEWANQVQGVAPECHVRSDAPWRVHVWELVLQFTEPGGHERCREPLTAIFRPDHDGSKQQ